MMDETKFVYAARYSPTESALAAVCRLQSHGLPDSIPSHVENLARDYEEMQVMLFGAPPEFQEILGELRNLEAEINATAPKDLSAAQRAGVKWPLPEKWDDQQTEQALFPDRRAPAFWRKHPEPDWAQIHQELQTHKDLTLQLVWQERRESNPDGYAYSRFCELYRRWLKKLDLVLRQEHRAGEKMFVDYAGATIPIHDPESAAVHAAAVFVAVLGASSYTFSEATMGQDLRNWIGSHQRAFEFYDGVTEVVVPDNLKSAVTHPSYYEPDLNPTYRDLGEHYGVAIIPARPYRPRDKAYVSYCTLSGGRNVETRLFRLPTSLAFENGVLVQRFI